MPPKQYQNPPSLILDPNMRYTATIKTAQGDMTLELFPERSTILSFWPVTGTTRATASTG